MCYIFNYFINFLPEAIFSARTVENHFKTWCFIRILFNEYFVMLSEKKENSVRFLSIWTELATFVNILTNCIVSSENPFRKYSQTYRFEPNFRMKEKRQKRKSFCHVIKIAYISIYNLFIRKQTTNKNGKSIWIPNHFNSKHCQFCACTFKIELLKTCCEQRTTLLWTTALCIRMKFV